MKEKVNIRFIFIMAGILLVGMFRIFSHTFDLGPLANLTPIGAMALFGGHYFSDARKAFTLPLLTLFISDVVVMKLFYPEFTNGLLYDGWMWTYLAFALMVLIGKAIKRVSVKSVFVSAFAAALAHWIISDFGVWMAGRIDISTGLPFTRDAEGLFRCYVLAIPYFKYTLAGNLLYSAILFGSFEIARLRIAGLSLTPSTSNG